MGKILVNNGKFQEIIDDADKLEAGKVKRILFCTGKVYYDLLAFKKAHNRKDVAIVRIEQLYPMAQGQLDGILKKYSKAKPYWVQEEPGNMGAWWYIQMTQPQVKWTPVTRPYGASPATGYAKLHEKEQKELVEKAFQ